MASGKKNYFRHSFFARNDIKLKMLRDEIGVGAYFYFFTLLEQCGEASSDELKSNYEFHDSTIRSLWNESLPKSMKICEKLMEVGLCSYKKYEKSFYFELPNLSKYLGHYQSKFPSNILENSPKERKGKERKVKEKKENNSEDKSSTTDVIDFNLKAERIAEVWNDMASQFDLPQVKLPLSKDRLKRIMEPLKEFKEASEWTDIIFTVPDNDFNLGINDRKWKANFDWLFHTTKFNYRKLWEARIVENN